MLCLQERVPACLAFLLLLDGVVHAACLRYPSHCRLFPSWILQGPPSLRAARKRDQLTGVQSVSEKYWTAPFEVA